MNLYLVLNNQLIVDMTDGRTYIETWKQICTKIGWMVVLRNFCLCLIQSRLKGVTRKCQKWNFPSIPMLLICYLILKEILPFVQFEEIQIFIIKWPIVHDGLIVQKCIEVTKEIIHFHCVCKIELHFHVFIMVNLHSELVKLY